ncbi:MAG TPA: RNA polymerase sigma factor [Bacillota bacterium]|mgnify:CR=1 FL=1|nr:RNA polymerase sigma factor [Bacillota bacterium]
MIGMMSIAGSKSDAERIEELIFAISRVDSSALAELYEKTKDAVYAYALSFLKNSYDAEDVLHDLYVSIWRSAAQYRARGKPMAWILTITRNLCMSKFRAQKRISDLPEEDWEPYLSANDSISIEDRLLLEACMKQLSREESEIVMLHAVSGVKHRDIAELMNFPLSTVLSKYHRALKKLRAILEKEDKRHE